MLNCFIIKVFNFITKQNPCQQELDTYLKKNMKIGHEHEYTLYVIKIIINISKSLVDS
jgi:hypothetical protein